MKIDQKGIIGILGILVLVVAVSGCGSPSEDDPYDKNKTLMMTAEKIKANATPVGGEEFQRNTLKYADTPIKLTGTVFQIDSSHFLMYMDDNPKYIVYVNMMGVTPSNLLEDDIVTVYGVPEGKVKYETVSGTENIIPSIEVWTDNVEIG